MSPDLTMRENQPDAYRLLMRLSREVDRSAHAAGLHPSTVDLVKTRISQLNGCAFCLRLHSREALQRGENADRLTVLSAWGETGYFSAVERAALGVAERVASLRSMDADLESDLSGAQAAAVAWVSVVTGALNRVAVSSRYDVSAN